VQSLSVSGFPDCRDDLSPHEDAVADVVLDDIFDGQTQEWDINALIAADAQDQELQDGLDDGAQDTQGHG
jgi:hypothetical protein